MTTASSSNDVLRIRGGNALRGEIRVAGAKNAALPLLCASLLTDKTCSLRNMPHLSDVSTCARLLTHHGADVNFRACADDKERYTDIFEIKAAEINTLLSPYDIVSKMRASFLVLGPLLARFGKAQVSLPGGCAIGQRPVDMHLAALKALGASLEIEEGYVHAKAPPGGLKGGRVTFANVSVGATEHAMTAAALCNGESVIENAAREPEIVNLADMLRAMGAQVEGDGTSAVRIQGKQTLGGCDIAVIPDRIEAGSFLIAGLITGGDLTVTSAGTALSAATVAVLREAGADITEDTEKDSFRIKGSPGGLRPVSVETAPYPGFATDMQAQLTALLCLTPGTSTVTETIFENRFMHVPEMKRAGADIVIENGKTARITGVKTLSGAELQATDLRASISLVLIAMAAEGESLIHNLAHIDRGYERIEEKLRAVGADIVRMRKKDAAA